MGTRINRETEGGSAEEGEPWQEDAGDYIGSYDAEGGSDEGGADEDALELTMEAGDQSEDEPQGPQDELLLDADRLADADQQVQPIGGRRRRMLGGGSDEGADEAAAAPARSGAGSTLFERMANLSRAGASSSDEEDEETDSDSSSSLRIPRFLGRQNNQ
jgi:cell division protein FtsZ